MSRREELELGFLHKAASRRDRASRVTSVVPKVPMLLSLTYNPKVVDSN
jgi:hypothetical protein